MVDGSAYNHNYVEEAQATKSEAWFHPNQWTDEAGKLIGAQTAIDILHAVVGISTEAGELLDPLKKAMFYGKDIDLVNLDEEIGDILWYVAIYCKARGVTIEQLMGRNINKLKTRYPDKFTQFHALNRNLEAERKILEG